MAAIDPQILLEEAKCYACFAQGSLVELMKLALLNRIAQGGSGPSPGASVGITWGPDPTFLSGTSFGSTFGFNETSIIFNGITTSDGIDVIGSGVIESLSFPALVTVTGSQDIENMGVVTSITYPVLQSVNVLTVINCPALTTYTAPALQTVGDSFYCQSTGVTSLSFPAWTSTAQLIADGNTSLTSFSAPNLIFVDGGNVIFENCALDEASVNHILARCVASALTNSLINLAAGTNAAPSGQGVADVATLTGNGCTVFTN